MSEYKVFLHRPWDMDAVQVLITHESGGLRRIAKPVELVFETAPDSGCITDPTLSLPPHIARPFLQAFADAIHRDGIKPTEQSFTEGELTATKKHLEDMRTLVLPHG